MTGTLTEGRGLARNLAALFLFFLPVLYLGIILAVALHEIAGHGLAAHVLGGRFNGFGLRLDGMGWAEVDVRDLSPSVQALVFLAGALATTFFSLILFALGLAFRRRTHAHLALFLLAFICLQDGQPYFFWDAIFLAGIGDFSRIANLFPSLALRIATIALCGLMTAGGIILFNTWFLKAACRLVDEGNRTTLRGRAALSIMMLTLQAVGWFMFPWDQVVPGIGLLPGLSAMALTIATLLFHVRPRRLESRGGPPHPEQFFRTPMLVAWTACLGTAAGIALWLQKGVHF